MTGLWGGLAVLLFSAPLWAQTAKPTPSVRALLELARKQSEQKNAAAALATLRSARAIAPNSEDVLSAYAEAVFASPTPDAAIPVLEALTRMYPAAARYHQREGVALLQAGDAEAAAAALQEAARLEPDQPATLVALGRAQNRRGLHAEAKPHLLRAVSLAPDDMEGVAALAEAEAGLGEMKDAEEHARRVLSRAGTPGAAGRAAVVLATILMAQERFAEARDTLQKAAAADPASGIDYDAPLARAYAGLQDTVNADKHGARSRQKTKAAEERVKRVRREIGFALRGKTS